MSTDLEAEEERTRWTPWAIAAAVLLGALFGVILLAGVRGYLTADPRAEAEQEDEQTKGEEERKKRPDFEVANPLIQPAEPEQPVGYVKPGHWTTTTQRMRANYRDFTGRSLGRAVDRDRGAFPVPHTPFVLRSSRPVALAQGAPKSTENTFYAPPVSRQIWLDAELEERGLRSSFHQMTPLTRMPSYQYHFVVLAREPSRYSFIKTLDSVNVPFAGETEFDVREDALHYRVVELDASDGFPLSDNPLTWTSIAYLLWDEVDPQLARMTPDEQRALVDWIHWGGQLIINGPGSLDLLKGTFLEAFLPAAGGGSRPIAADDLQALNDHWMISTAKAPGEPLVPTRPWSGITLERSEETSPPDEFRTDRIVRPTSLWESTGGLLAERRVGRGRIVVSAMQLAERDLITWRSGFQSLFNAAILRRPPREYRPAHFGNRTLIWDASDDESLADRRLDARLTSRMRYVTRDLGVETAYRYVDVEDQAGQFHRYRGRQADTPVTREYQPSEHVGGVGAWNDFSPMANAARDALREAAGVDVPDSGFVIVCLAAYLIALVPLNWLVFHALGRVEWAWIAAPIIAVAGTFVVINQAQLDIGFVRAQTEVGVLELQGDHPRGHLTRYTALYTSLSTTYELEFANHTTLAAPFPRALDDPRYQSGRLTPVDFQRYDTVRLAGVPIASNSTGFVHSEQMRPIDGAICIGRSTAGGRPQIENRSELALGSVAVVHRPWEGPLRGMWIGELAPGRSVGLALSTLASAEEANFAQKRADEARLQGEQLLNLEPMFRLALDPNHLDPGETRLVGRMEEILPGQQIRPEASQVRGATLVVAHLDYGPFPTLRPDRNTRQDVAEEIDDEEQFAL